MPVINLTKKTWLATKVYKADNFLTRLVGLLKRKALGPEEALWLMPNKGIHTIGMKFPIDVIFLNSKNKVVSMIPAMRPWRVSWFRFNAYSVVELPEGAIRKSQSEVGDQFEISLAETSEMDNLRDTRLSQIG